MDDVDTAQIIENISLVRGNIEQAARRAGRDPKDITLVAVSKTFPAEAITAAVQAGTTDIGESRIQEATAKIDALGRIATWHLIGHLQSNKAARAVEYFDMIQSVDTVGIAEKISRHAVAAEKTVDCLIEMNSSGEDSKFGLPPEDTIEAAETIAALPGINLRGLMTIGPWTTNEGCVRKAFDFTRETFADMRTRLGDRVSILSMGMSSDYEWAIECGSTMVRVGTAIFGTR